LYILQTVWEENMLKQLKIIVEKHPDVYVAYPLGLKGIVVGEGDTYEEALNDVKSANHFFTLKHSEKKYSKMNQPFWRPLLLKQK